MPVSIAKAFAAGLKNVAGGDECEQNQERIRSLIRFLHLNTSDIDKEIARDLVKEIYTWYFSSNSGALAMAKCLRRELEGKQDYRRTRKSELIDVVLVETATMICVNLDTSEQMGHIAGNSLETAYWLAQQIPLKESIVAQRLMRTCGRRMSGAFVDAFFWRIYGLMPGSPLLESLAVGMLTCEGAAKIQAKYLTEFDRTQEVSDQAVQEVRDRQENCRAKRARTETGAVA